MDKIAVSVQVFFEGPFWVGVTERIYKEKLYVCKVTFGAEPKDCAVSEFFLRNYFELQFSPAVETVVKDLHKNPKRVQRLVHRQMQEVGIGTKSQQALKLQQEQLKTERRMAGKERREADELHRFELKQQKRKEKHKGR